MKSKSLKIFEKKKGIYISPENIIVISWVILISIIYYLKACHEINFKGWETIILIFGAIYTIGLMACNFFRYEKEFGEYQGRITFSKDQIKIRNIKYSLDQIKKIEFIDANDIKGMFVNSTLKFSPHLSNGLGNQIVIELKNGEKIKYNFLQTKSKKIEFFNKILIHYNKKGILSWLKLMEILNNIN